MGDFVGVVIEESLEDRSVLGRLKIIKTEVEKTTEEHKSHVTQWTLDTIRIPEAEAPRVAEELSRALDPKHGWYADFKNETHHYIVFYKKVFYIDRASKEQYDAAKAYGLSLGIPEHQVDFHPDIKEWKR